MVLVVVDLVRYHSNDSLSGSSLTLTVSIGGVM